MGSKTYYNKSFEDKGDGWKGVKANVSSVYSPKDIKDKTALFKTPKYININKSEVMSKINISKKDGPKPFH